MVPPSTTPLPCILCLHGGGTSARIFKIQTVRIQRQLKDDFRFIFVDAPFLSEAGPGVSPMFDDLGPFFRWAPRGPDENGDQVTAAIERGLRGQGEGVVMGMNHREGDAMGPVVAVLGFSQGSAVAAGLLEQQQRQNKAGEKGYGLRFGILTMGVYPLFRHGAGPAQEPKHSHDNVDASMEGAITIPSVHLLGLQDPHLARGRLLYRCFDPSTAKLMKMDLEHRLPIAEADNEKLVQEILTLYRDTKGSSDS